MNSKRLMVVDAQNQFIRSYIVDPSVSINGQPIGGSKGFLKILNKLCRTMKPDLVVVIWDGEGGSQKRRSVNKNYKAGRKPIRLNRDTHHLTDEQVAENKIWQQMRVVEYLNQTPIIQFMEPHVEADDVIAHTVQLPNFKGWQKVIVSSDKDFIQLLDDETVLFRPTQGEVLNKNKVIEKFGIHPTNFALARAMAGDTSDNLPGIGGVGLPTVAKRFPFFREEKECLLAELVDHCIEQGEESSLKIFHRIVEQRNLIGKNFMIMQLYSPSISVQRREIIKQTFDNYSAEFNKTSLRTIMHKDGIGEISLNDLFETFNRMVSQF